jgi:putative heme iron utilization protein
MSASLPKCFGHDRITAIPHVFSERTVSAQSDLTDAYCAYEQLLSQTRSLILGTINTDGTPRVSYAPFILNERRQFYIFISQLAAHTAHLQRTGQASLMLIEDESATDQIFARKRATFQCQARLIKRDGTEAEAVLAEFERRFGQMVGLLKSLPDFQLFKLQPQSGLLVLGFGQAYELSGERFAELTHRRRG